jgi:hypothetical protein
MRNWRRVLLDYLLNNGIELPPEAGPVTYPNVSDWASRQGLADSIPPQRFFAMNADMRRGFSELTATHEPGVFEGDMILIVSSDEPDDKPTSSSWRPYVTGRVVDYSIDCRHAAMLLPDAIRCYGPKLPMVP